MNIIENIRETLFELQDISYRDFQSKLIPTIDMNTFIGVRTPQLRKYAKELLKSGEYIDFLADLPHKYFDENQLHSFILCEMKEYEQVLEEINRFLPHIDNWATCDQLSPKIFKKNKKLLLDAIDSWLDSDETYTIRFGIGMLMTHYLDENFNPEYMARIGKIRSDEYYINMMLAWYFATALAKQWGTTIPYLTEYKPTTWVHNKTIQKARESYRITPEQKEYLKTLKV